MGTIRDLAYAGATGAFREFETNNVPATGAHQPNKSTEIPAFIDEVEDRIVALEATQAAGSGTLGFDTLPEANTDGLGFAFPTIAAVRNDTIPTTSRARASNVATVGVNATSYYAIGQVVRVENVGGTGYNGLVTITALPTTTSISYANTGGNESVITDTGGTVSRNGLYQKQGAIAAGSWAFFDDLPEREIVENIEVLDDEIVALDARVTVIEGTDVETLPSILHRRNRRLEKLTDPVVIVDGDSFINSANQNNLANVYMATNAYSELTWLRQYLPWINVDTWYDAANTITTFAGGNQGRSGLTLQGLLAGDSDGLTLDQLLDRGPCKWFIIARGLNDLWLAGRTAAQLLADFTTAIGKVRARGIPCGVVNIGPAATTGTNAITDATIRQRILDVNAGLPAIVATANSTPGPRVVLIDRNAALNNGSNEPLAGTTYDALHPNTLGSERSARLAWVPAAKKLFPNTAAQPLNRFFDNSCPNGNFAGSEAATGLRVTGTVAPGWDIRFNDDAPVLVTGGTVSAVATVETHPDFSDGSQRQVFVITPGGSNAIEHLQLSRSAFAIPAEFQGKWVSGNVFIDMSAYNGWRGVVLSIYGNDGFLIGGNTYYGLSDEYPSVATNFCIPTEAKLLGSTPTTWTFLIDIYLKGVGATSTGVIYVRDAYFGVAEDPRRYRGYL